MNFGIGGGSSNDNSGNAKRFTGLEAIKLDGSERMPSTKFNVCVNILRDRISKEIKGYSNAEKIETELLLRFADNIQLLFLSQDSPLMSTQYGPAVNKVADDMVRKWQKPLLLEEMPIGERKTFDSLAYELRKDIAERDKLLEGYVLAEMFLRQMINDEVYDLSCLLGVSVQTRERLAILSEFNQMMTKRFNLMRTHVGNDNIYKVNYVLGHINQFERFFRERVTFGGRDRVQRELLRERTPARKTFRNAYNFNFV